MRWKKIRECLLQDNLPSGILILFLFTIAFAIRISGSNFGFPYFFHPDERKLTILAWNMSEEGKWNPENFYYPTGFIYLLLLGFKFISLFGLNFHNHHADLIMLHWIGRFYSALLGAGTIVLIYKIGNRLYGVRAGIVASILLCFNLIHLRHSHYATTDIASLFFILLGLFLIISLYKSGKFSGLAPFVCGISMGFKYSAWPIIFPLLSVSFLTRHSQHSLFQKLRTTILFYFLGFLFTTPFALIDPGHFLSSISEILIIPHSKWLGLTHPEYLYYFSDFKPVAGVGLIFIFSILGLFSRIRNWRINDTLFISFFLPYIVMASLSIEKIDRFFLPAIIIFILWAAIGIDNVALVLSRLKGRHNIILCIIVLLFSLPFASESVRYIQYLEDKDNRIIASEWIKKNIPLHSNLALFAHPWANPPIESEDYNIIHIPLVYKNKDIDREKLKLYISKNRFIAAVIRKIFKKHFSPEIFQKRLEHMTSIDEFALYPLRYFKEKGVDYIIISGFFKEDLLDRDTERYFPKLSISAYNFFSQLKEDTNLVYALPSVEGFYRDFALSPSIEIYKIEDQQKE